MAADPARRKTFVDSVMSFVDTFGWDGIDFDWEYPGDRWGAIFSVSNHHHDHQGGLRPRA